MRFQTIYDIAELCRRKGITQAVLCPGSRSAPLTLAFARHPEIQSWTFSDERSAAFIALGVAIETRKPTVLVCTSGTAAYNFAPAVAEAFYQQVPLLVFTADRPGEWIDQWDGQTIHQENLYGSHSKAFYELPEDTGTGSRRQILEIVNNSINVATCSPQGPVHINSPFAEPLYPAMDEQIDFGDPGDAVKDLEPNVVLGADEISELVVQSSQYNKVLVIVGQQREISIDLLNKWSSNNLIPVVGDVISNAHGLKSLVNHADVFLAKCSEEAKRVLQPELLITFGKSVISKNLKLYLRSFKPKEHWHIQNSNSKTPDPFRTLTRVIQSEPAEFFKHVKSTMKSGFDSQKRENYYRLWEAEEHRTARAIQEYFATPQLTEFSVLNEVLKSLPHQANLHLANSLSVRYANYIGLAPDQINVTVCSNRGTSGIDGCTSTAVGHSLLSPLPTILVTGDMAFFYDRNAFWHNYKLPNLRIIVLNNHGGSIFGIIDGPGNLPEADQYFITNQRLTARKLCEEFNIEYLHLNNLRKLKNLLKYFFEMDGTTKLLEIESSHESVKEALNEFMNQIRRNYEP